MLRVEFSEGCQVLHYTIFLKKAQWHTIKYYKGTMSGGCQNHKWLYAILFNLFTIMPQ